MRIKLSLLLFCLIVGLNTQAAVLHPKAKAQQDKTETANNNSTSETTRANTKALSKKELRAQKRSARKSFKAKLKEIRKNARGADTELILLCILALFIPPLAMYLYEGDATGRFWISLFLALAAIPLAIIVSALGGLAFAASIIYTLYCIISDNVY